MVFSPPLVKELGEALEELFAVSSGFCAMSVLVISYLIIAQVFFRHLCDAQWDNNLMERTMRERQWWCFQVWGVDVVPHVSPIILLASLTRLAGRLKYFRALGIFERNSE